LVLVLQSAQVALIMGLVLGSVYLAVFQFLRRRQSLIAEVANVMYVDRLRLAQESLGGIKELQVLGREEPQIRRYVDATRMLVEAQARQALIAPLPRYILEPVAFGGIVLVTLL